MAAVNAANVWNLCFHMFEWKALQMGDFILLSHGDCEFSFIINLIKLNIYWKWNRFNAGMVSPYFAVFCYANG